MKKMSMFALLLAAVLVTSYSVSGTYAKYTSTFTGSDTARVAKWAFTINGDDTIMTTNTFTFDLFNTVMDSNGTDAEGNIELTDGTIIAPGTQGSFQIVLANDSEVDAQYTIDYTETKTANIPVEYSLDGTDWTADINDLDATATDINMNGGVATINVYWRWVFEVADDAATTTDNETTIRNEADTVLGTTGTDTVKVEAKITATQVD